MGTPEELLRTLIEAEISARDASNARTRLKAAAFPVIKTLEEFDLGVSTVPKATFTYLASLEWIRARENLCLVGPAGTGLGPRSVQMMLNVLRRAFQEAVRDRKMAWNPAEGVRGPRQRPRKVTPWTDDEVRAFMDAARRDRLHAIWRLSLLALRPEEVAGLRWDSVDLTARTLTVARVQVIVAGKVLERETAKTPAGERTLPLDEGTVKALRELRKLQRKERMAAGEAYRPGSHGGYVAADEIGAGYSTQRLRGTFYRLVASAGLRRITFYHARHSALSYLLNSGQVPIAVVAAWAGHADGGATALKHYIRVRPGDLEAARDAIAALLGA